MNSEVAKWIIVAGIGITLLGIILYFFHDKLHWIGNLPGDIRIENKNVKFYFPITTMLLVSLLITLIVKLINRLLH